jgi:predicted RecB family nuclease
MQITRRLIEAYLDCKYKAHLLAEGNRGDPHDLEIVQAELQESYVERAAAALVRKYHKAPSDFTDIDIHSGQEVIFAPTLEDEEMAFEFDALRRTDGESSLGPFHYCPVLFWQAESLGRNQTLLMAAGGIILSRHQRVQPKTATVIFGTQCRARTLHLAQHYKAAQQVLDDLTAIVSERVVPRLILNDHCGLCEFRTECRQQAIKSDDLSLLGHMTERKINNYAQTGTLTVTQLSYTYHARRHRNVHAKQNPRSLPLHALAIRQQRILVVGKPAFPKTGVRIYFDAEGDFDRKFTYLLGLLVIKDGQEEMISLWADDASQQKRLSEQFLDVLKQHNGYTLFHYGQYEAEILRKMRAVVRPKKILDAAIAASVNVLAPLHSDVYFPTYSNGLKEIGKYLGISWSDPNASGLQSLAWRKRWEMTGGDQFKQKLVAYNADDCRALKEVTETLESIGQEQPHEDSAAAWEEVTFEPGKRDWGKIGFVLPDFDYINKCAYFDYQHDRVYPRQRCRPSMPLRMETRLDWQLRSGCRRSPSRSQRSSSDSRSCDRNLSICGTRGNLPERSPYGAWCGWPILKKCWRTFRHALKSSITG